MIRGTDDFAGPAEAPDYRCGTKQSRTAFIKEVSAAQNDPTFANLEEKTPNRPQKNRTDKQPFGALSRQTCRCEASIQESSPAESSEGRPGHRQMKIQPERGRDARAALFLDSFEPKALPRLSRPHRLTTSTKRSADSGRPSIFPDPPIFRPSAPTSSGEKRRIISTS